MFDPYPKRPSIPLHAASMFSNLFHPAVASAFRILRLLILQKISISTTGLSYAILIILKNTLRLSSSWIGDDGSFTDGRLWIESFSSSPFLLAAKKIFVRIRIGGNEPMPL